MAEELASISRVSIEKPQRNCPFFLGPMVPRMSGVRSTAMERSPSFFFILSSATAAGR